jgi:hypothetical protein
MTENTSRANSEGVPGFFVKCWAIVRTSEIKRNELPTKVITGGIYYQEVFGHRKNLKWDAKVYVPTGWLRAILGRDQMFSRLSIHGVTDMQMLAKLQKLFDSADEVPVPGGSVMKYRIPKSLKKAGRMLLREIQHGR